MKGRVALILPAAIASSTVSSGLGIPCPMRLWQSMQSIRRVVSLDLSRLMSVLTSVDTATCLPEMYCFVLPSLAVISMRSILAERMSPVVYVTF